MDTAYFRSREFVVAASAAVGLLIVGGVLAGAGPFDDPWTKWRRDRCAGDIGAGDVVTPAVTTQDPAAISARVYHSETHTVDASGLVGGRLSLCTLVGNIVVRPTDADQVALRFDLHLQDGDVPERAVSFQSHFRVESGVLHLATEVIEEERAWYVFLDDAPPVFLTLEVPGDRLWDLDLHSTVGDQSVHDVALRSLHAHTDVGNVGLQGVSVEGRFEVLTDVGDVGGQRLTALDDVAVHTDVGNVDLSFDRLGTGSHSYLTDVGDVAVAVPDDNRTGYSIVITTEVGSASASVGPEASREHRSNVPSERLSVRTVAYEAQPVRVDIRVKTDVGSVSVFQ